MDGFFVEALKKNFGPLLRRLWESVGFWRTLSLTLFPLVFLVVYKFIFNKEQLAAFFLKEDIIDHDKNIFDGLNNCICEEQLVLLVRRLRGDNSCYPEELDWIVSTLEFCSFEENQFISKHLQRTVVKLGSSMKELNEFCSTYFHPFGPGDQIVLLPDHNFERGGDGTEEQKKIYENAKAALEMRIDKVVEDYREFRKSVKSKLLI